MTAALLTTVRAAAKPNVRRRAGKKRKMMFLENKFNLGQIVYIRTDKEQQPRMVIGITIRPSGLLYELNFGSGSSWHYEMELSDEKDILAATSG